MNNALPEEASFESLLGDFLAESEELLSSLSSDLRNLGDRTWVQQATKLHTCDDQLMNKMFRAAHSLKGLSAMLGLNPIHALTHRVESVLDAVRNGQLFFTPNSIELLLDSIDCLMSMVDNLKAECEEVVHCDHVVTGIEALLKSIDENADTSPPNEVDRLLAETPTISSTAIGEECHDPSEKENEFLPSQTTLRKPVETLRVELTRLDHLAQMADQLMGRNARLVGISEVVQANTVVESTSRLLADLEPFLENAYQLGDRQDQRQIASVVTMASKIQDELLSAQQEMAAISLANLATGDLMETMQQFERIADAIKKIILETRLVTMNPLLTRFRRVIRDISRSNGKQIDVVVHGEQIRLDKRTIDELCEPLIHIARNSADHGIESPHERTAAGKSALGTVLIEAYLCGNNICIRISDDGRGLNPSKILQKGVDKGLVKESETRKLTPQQIYAFVWEPGFSTASEVTDVSGRGMGMDIVKSKIESLKGSVDLVSTAGAGTTFTIKLPLTMAILPCVLIEVGESAFGVPIESVVKTVRLPLSENGANIDKQTARVRGHDMPMVNLSELFPWEQPAEELKDQGDLNLLVVETQGTEVALVVDDLLGEEDVVIRPVADCYQEVRGITGASILGNGRMSFILDVGTLFEAVGKFESRGLNNLN